MNDPLHFFTSCPPHTEDLLLNELKEMGFSSLTPTVKGVFGEGPLSLGYRACIRSRVANRVFLLLETATAETGDDLYNHARSFPWEDHFSPDRTIRISCAIKNVQYTNPNHASLVLKDGIVDRFRDIFGRRPSVEKQHPDVRIYSYIDEKTVSFYFDFSGESIHKRGYRVRSVEAGLKENVAAALLYRSDWHNLIKRSDGCSTLVDPMCGSGTIVIEAALLAMNRAPGIFRSSFGFMNWKQHDRHVWDQVKQEAKEGERTVDVHFFGFDCDDQAIKASRLNAEKAGVSHLVTFTKKNIVDIRNSDIPHGRTGLVVTNPPYGNRLGEETELYPLYQAIGRSLKRSFSGWNGSVLTGNKKLARFIGLQADKIHTLLNGPLTCGLYHFILNEKNRFSPQIYPLSLEKREKSRTMDTTDTTALYNRIQKNVKSLRKLLKPGEVTCYRVYDADIPEFSVAIDIYESQWIHIQEYEPPVHIDTGKRLSRLRQVIAAAVDIFSVPEENIYCKIRRRMRGREQYRKQAALGEYFIVQEYGHRFFINLVDYVDTGLFLDSREVRKYIEGQSAGKRFLNLFCYTGTATVYAAAGGASTTTSVDHNRRYLSQVDKNLGLNGFSGPNHSTVYRDCFDFIDSCSATYDLIFLGPPAFSNTKGKSESFDLTRDHGDLLNSLIPLLSEDGIIIFLSNTKGFALDRHIMDARIIATDISEKTGAVDFSRKKGSHHCYTLQKKTAEHRGPL